MNTPLPTPILTDNKAINRRFTQILINLGLGHRFGQIGIAVCQDENFHEDVCLVAIEPSSNYIILEKYAPNRKAATWTKEMNERLSLLPVKVIQSNSDEALGIKAHVKNDLGAHHSPDLFHVQQENVKATAPALAPL